MAGPYTNNTIDLTPANKPNPSGREGPYEGNVRDLTPTNTTDPSAARSEDYYRQQSSVSAKNKDGRKQEGRDGETVHQEGNVNKTVNKEGN
ncbi:hypothetical protein QBC43DRAFT_292050 [Cladorrhinum sp. PSN259]|nr:hypothetical protein QBC43DRAFT_292050 [Cladorrhinum sp. PSN259]